MYSPGGVRGPGAEQRRERRRAGADRLLDQAVEEQAAVLTDTREAPSDWSGHRGRIDRELLMPLVRSDVTIFICGSNGFVESASGLALECGVDAARIRTGRFGPTG